MLSNIHGNVEVLWLHDMFSRRCRVEKHVIIIHFWQQYILYFTPPFRNGKV